MSGRLVIHAWVDVADPWSYIGMHRLLGGIALARADDARPIDVDVHAFLGPGRAWETSDARKIAAVASREGLTIDPQTLVRRVPAGRRRSLHRLVYAAKAAGTDLADGARRGLETYMEIQAAVFDGDDARLTQIESRAGMAEAHAGMADAAEAQVGMADAAETRSPAEARSPDETCPPAEARQLDEARADKTETTQAKANDLGWQAERTGEAADEADRRQSLDEQIDRDIADAKRMRIGGLPLVVIGGVVSVVGAQGSQTYAELIAEASGVVERIDRAPEDSHLRLG
ncbi:MAG: DsbA family protein [Actinomycetaceae bacterium]|nr:DsbA family protein [Actinomycetaceae bacterium]